VNIQGLSHLKNTKSIISMAWPQVRSGNFYQTMHNSQQVKHPHTKPTRLLQTLPHLLAILREIAMEFIQGI
jgi:hypothetical protein